MQMRTLRLVVPHTSAGATRRQILWFRVRSVIGRWVTRHGFPGAISATEFRDDVTGDLIKVTVGESFTVISVSGRDYYFDRFTGRFDGTGMGCG